MKAPAGQLRCGSRDDVGCYVLVGQPAVVTQAGTVPDRLRDSAAQMVTAPPDLMRPVVPHAARGDVADEELWDSLLCV